MLFESHASILQNLTFYLLLCMIRTRFAFSEALKKIYGINNNSTVLPPMPVDGDTWSVMHSWAIPTKSFLEFVMFSRLVCGLLNLYKEPRLIKAMKMIFAGCL